MRSSGTIRVLSFNIHKGFGTGNLSFTLAKIKKAITALNLDIVFLQEVQGEHASKAKKHSDWPKESQFEFLADQTWKHFAYGKNAIYADGHHGNAILSKFPIVEWENIDISTNAFERRGALYARLEVPHQEQSLHCLNLHLNMFKAGRVIQIERVCSLIEQRVKEDERLIVAGDFNDWSQKASHQLASRFALKEVFHYRHRHYAKTYPSQAPIFALDRIYCRSFDIHDAQRLSGKEWTSLSDHLALLTELS